MKKLIGLLNWYKRTWWESISDINFYKRLQKIPIIHSVVFTLIFYMILAVGYTAWFQINLRPNIEASFVQASEELLSQIPDDETFSWDGNKLDFSQSTNITIQTPNQLKKIVGIPNNILEVSSNEEIEGSLVGISPTKFIVSFQDQKQASNLSEVFADPASISGGDLKSAIKSAVSTMPTFLSTLLAILPLIIFIGFLLSRGMFLIIEIFMVWLVLKLYQRISSFGYVFRLSLHLLVIAEIPHQLGNILNLNLPFSLLSLSFWILLAFIVLQLEKKPAKS